MPFQGNWFWVEKYILFAEGILKWIQNDPKLSQNDPKIVPTNPKWSPPIPIPGVSKSLLTGGNKLEQKQIYDDFLLFL